MSWSNIKVTVFEKKMAVAGSFVFHKLILFSFTFSSIVNITTPVLLAIIIGVAYQFGYITYVKDADSASLTVSLKTLEHRLKALEGDIGNLGNQTLTQTMIEDLETRLDGVQKILENVKDETRRDIDRLMSGDITTDRHVYITQRGNNSCFNPFPNDKF